MSNIYMDYLTESEREELILEKEIDLLLVSDQCLYEAGKIDTSILKKLDNKVRDLFPFKKKKVEPVVLPKFYEGSDKLLSVSEDLYKQIKTLVDKLDSISKINIDKYTDDDCDTFEDNTFDIVEKYFKSFNKNSYINTNKIVNCNDPHFMDNLGKLINNMGDISKKFIEAAKVIIKKSEQIDDEENPWMITRNYTCRNINHMINIVYDNINTLNQSLK